jgi:hypothetical protein
MAKSTAISSFTRPVLKDIREDINNALRAVSSKYGITLDIGKIRFDADHFSTKLEAGVTTTVVAVTPAPTATALSADPLKALVESAHGVGALDKWFKFPAGAKRIFKFAAYRPNADKNVIVIETNRGARWVISEAQMRTCRVVRG